MKVAQKLIAERAALDRRLWAGIGSCMSVTLFGMYYFGKNHLCVG